MVLSIHLQHYFKSYLDSPLYSLLRTRIPKQYRWYTIWIFINHSRELRRGVLWTFPHLHFREAFDKYIVYCHLFHEKNVSTCLQPLTTRYSKGLVHQKAPKIAKITWDIGVKERWHHGGKRWTNRLTSLFTRTSTSTIFSGSGRRSWAQWEVAVGISATFTRQVPPPK